MTYGQIMMYTQVSVPQSHDDISFVWQGGDTIRMERDGLLAFDPYGVVSHHDPRVGDVFTYGSFQLRCTVACPEYIEAVLCSP